MSALPMPQQSWLANLTNGNPAIQAGLENLQNYNSRMDQRHMEKVFAANPQFAQQLYGAKAQQAQLAMAQDEQRRKLQQQSALKNLAGQLGQGPFDRQKALTQYGEITGDLAPLFGIGQDTPSAIREYQYFSNLPEDQKQQYLAVKRSQQILDLGGGYGAYSPTTGAVTPVAGKTLAPGELPETKAAQTAATEQAKVNVERETAAPKVVSMVDTNLQVINDALNHPGFDANFGKMGVLPNIPGGEAADAATYLEQIKGTAFLTAIGEMKGSGAISEKEGDAATAAVTRLQKSQSPESARKALAELSAILQGAKARATKGTTLQNQSADPLEGKTATGPNGQKIIRRNGAWVPM